MTDMKLEQCFFFFYPQKTPGSKLFFGSFLNAAKGLAVLINLRSNKGCYYAALVFSQQMCRHSR